MNIIRTAKNVIDKIKFELQGARDRAKIAEIVKTMKGVIVYDEGQKPKTFKEIVEEEWKAHILTPPCLRAPKRKEPSKFLTDEQYKNHLESFKKSFFPKEKF